MVKKNLLLKKGAFMFPTLQFLYVRKWYICILINYESAPTDAGIEKWVQATSFKNSWPKTKSLGIRKSELRSAVKRRLWQKQYILVQYFRRTTINWSLQDQYDPSLLTKPKTRWIDTAVMGNKQPKDWRLSSMKLNKLSVNKSFILSWSSLCLLAVCSHLPDFFWF